MVRRGDVDELSQRVRAVDDRLGVAIEQTAALGEQLTRTGDALRAGLRDVEVRRPDYGPVLTELRQQLQKQAVTLAELVAMPRSVPAPEMPIDVPVVAVAGLPAELAHQIAKLEDEDPAARFEAVDELLRSENLDVLEHLLPMLKDEDLFVRRLVVEGLRDFRDPSVVDALLVALADPEDIVRDTAWRSLKVLTGQKLPFEASGSRDSRARAQQRWQDWWQKNRDSFGV